MIMMHMKIGSFLAAMVLIAMGCQSEVVPNSGNHPPTAAAQVVLYQDPPKKYQDLGTIEVPVGGDVHWDEKGDATAGFEKLKSQAAALGANGVLLATDNPMMPKVVAGTGGMYFRVPLRSGNPSVAMAKAIWVVKE
jgi:hypothetical protein